MTVRQSPDTMPAGLRRRTAFSPLRLLIAYTSLLTIPLSATAALNILVVGGSGRVGGSTVRWIRTLADRDDRLRDVSVRVGGRSKASFEKAKRNGVVPSKGVDFVRMDLDGGDDDALKSAIDGCGLVVHTAGPFQGRMDPALLRCCLEKGVAYVDVCDEWDLAVTSKKMADDAKQAGVAAVVSSGIWPGVSALMAAEAVAQLASNGKQCETLDFSFFTAGTGNAGPTIVSATFLLLATQVLTYADGKEREKEPWTERRDIDFGPVIGVKPVWLLDNPDVPTTATTLNVLNASSRFGTDPLFWNYLFGAMKAIPRSLLYNRDAMQGFALFSEPIIRLVDKLVGATNAMRVDARSKGGEDVVTMRIAHPDLEQCVGLATAAFALEVLRGTVPAGVWFPAELPQEARTSILDIAKEDSIVYEV